MSEVSSQEVLHRQFANGLSALIEQHSQEPLVNQLERELNDPSLSLVAALKSVDSEEGVFYQPGDTSLYFRKPARSDDILDYFDFLDENCAEDIINTNEKISMKIDEIIVAKSKDDIVALNNKELPAVALVCYRLLVAARRLLRDPSTPSERLSGIFYSAIVAVDNMPEGYDGSQSPKKHKNETAEEILFRTAIGVLRDASTLATKAGREYYTLQKRLLSEQPGGRSLADYLSAPENEILRQGFNDVRASRIAHKILDKLADPSVTNESFVEELHKQSRLRALKNPEASIPTEETNWTILPPGAMEEIERTGETSSEYTPVFVDPERLKWLARLATRWSSDSYIAVADLENTGETQYYAAILPQMINGQIVEHAVAENASSGNATYVFRAERGIEDDGTLWLTWKDVLKDDKRGARALGARKIKHVACWDENVHEYLTRSPDELDRVGYRR